MGPEGSPAGVAGALAAAGAAELFGAGAGAWVSACAEALGAAALGAAAGAGREGGVACAPFTGLSCTFQVAAPPEVASAGTSRA